MLPYEWRAEEEDREKVEVVLEDVDNGVTFPANGDVAVANAVIVEWFCITKRILDKDLPNTWEKVVARSCWDRIKEDDDVAVAERGEDTCVGRRWNQRIPMWFQHCGYAVVRGAGRSPFSHGNYSKNR